MPAVNDFIRSLTLFLGVSPERLWPLIEKASLEFSVFEPGEEIVTPGSRAIELKMLLSGEAVIERQAADGVKVSWKAQEGHPIDLPALYGLAQAHVLRAYARERCRIVSIPKQHFSNMYDSEPIILLNLLNELGLSASKEGRISESNTVGMWLLSLARLADSAEAYIEVRLDRICELLSLARQKVLSQLDVLVSEGRIEWLPENNLIKINSESFI